MITTFIFVAGVVTGVFAVALVLLVLMIKAIR